MIRFAKRVLRAMPIKSNQFAKKLAPLNTKEEVIQFLVVHEYHGILIRLFGEERTNDLVDKYEDASDAPNDDYEDIMSERGDPARELKLLEPDDTEELSWKFSASMWFMD